MGREYQSKKKKAEAEKEIQDMKQEMEDMKINMKYLMANKFLKDDSHEEEASIYECHECSMINLNEKERDLIFPKGYEKEKEN